MHALVWALMVGGTAAASGGGGGAPEELVGLSATGDGTTPSALQLIADFDLDVPAADMGLGASARGDLSYGIPIPLPPALLPPELGLTYSSGAGPASVLGRGWSLSAGMTIERITGRAASAYDAADDPHRISGGGLDGLLVWADDHWQYQSTAPQVVEATLDDGTWTVTVGGTTTTLVTRGDLPADVPGYAWHTPSSTGTATRSPTSGRRSSIAC